MCAHICLCQEWSHGYIIPVGRRGGQEGGLSEFVRSQHEVFLIQEANEHQQDRVFPDVAEW